MTMPDPLGPFRAGPGGLPPYLAGRESVQAACRAFVAEVRHGRPPPREIVLYGPRGNGKTALLVWLEKEAATDSGLDVLRLTPAAIRTETMLVERLLPVSWRQRLAPERISVYGITWRPGENRAPPLDVALAARAEKKPLVLVLDEAHTLDAGVGGALLNASQQVGRELPFLLVLAGTPDLQSRLGAMNVTFWNRAERHPIGRLDPRAAAAALQKPLEREGIGIDEDAVAHMGSDSHGYPYFVQLWGEAVWRQVCTPAPEAQRRITRAVVDTARAPATSSQVVEGGADTRAGTLAGSALNAWEMRPWAWPKHRSRTRERARRGRIRGCASTSRSSSVSRPSRNLISDCESTSRAEGSPSSSSSASSPLSSSSPLLQGGGAVLGSVGVADPGQVPEDAPKLVVGAVVESFGHCSMSFRSRPHHRTLSALR